MTEPPGVPSVLGIEAVEWFSEGGDSVTVRVTGRWRRRRPAWSGQPTLVVEAQGRRHRFPAMPEPPSLTGAGPGTWRISFAVPVALAPDLGGRSWLQFGSVVVALPAAAEPLGAGEGELEFAGPDSSQLEQADEALHPASSELEAESVRRRAKEAEAAAAELAERVHALEHALAAAHGKADELAASLADRELVRRAADQRAHAEQALRRDLARQLSARSNEAERARQALGDLAAAEERIRELEAELGEARRRGDEAEQIAAAAAVARERAEDRTTDAQRRATDAERQHTDAERRATDAEQRATDAEQRAAEAGTARRAPPPAIGAGSAELLRFERGLIGHRTSAERRVPSEPSTPVTPATPGGAGGPSPDVTPRGASSDVSEALIGTLRRELDAHARGEAALRARVIAAESTLGARELLERRTATILVALRRELDGLRSAWAAERAGRVAAQQRADELAREAAEGRYRSRQAHDAIVELRSALRELHAAPDEDRQPPNPEDLPQPATEDPPPAEVAEQPPQGEAAEPDRFNEARVRLREAIAPPDAAPEPAPAAARSGTTEVKPWLEPIFRGLARTDPDGAGRLLLALLPAQRAAYPAPVAYDLVLGGHRGCARVTVKDGPPVIRYADGPRPGGEVDFQVLGDPAAVARLLTAGPLRRLVGRGVARVRGRRHRVEALRALIAVRLDLPGLYRAGVRLEPEMALTIIARMIEPAWTARERFTLAYAGEAGTVYLLVRDGHAVQVTDEAPVDKIATTITGPAEALALVLAGERGARGERVTVTGEDWPLALLRKWIKRAQSD